jgi:hypothetical protein
MEASGPVVLGSPVGRRSGVELIGQDQLGPPRPTSRRPSPVPPSRRPSPARPPPSRRLGPARPGYSPPPAALPDVQVRTVNRPAAIDCSY